MADQVFTDFYDHVFKVISTDATVVAAVASLDNIRPSNDPIEPGTGVVIYYSWTASQWNRRSRSGVGTFNLTVASGDNKVSALQLLERIKEVTTEKTLTNAFNLVRVPKFRENEALNDEGTGITNRFEASTTFDVRLVKAA